MVHEQSRTWPHGIAERALPYLVPPAKAHIVYYSVPCYGLLLIFRFPRNTDPPNHLKLSFSLPTAYPNEPSRILQLACLHDGIARACKYPR